MCRLCARVLAGVLKGVVAGGFEAVAVSLGLPRVKFRMPGQIHASCGENANDVVILGCGIIGLCTAYYLTESGNTDPKSIHLVDSSPKLFHCASGLAAGFLSADCTYESTRRVQHQRVASSNT